MKKSLLIMLCGIAGVAFAQQGEQQVTTSAVFGSSSNSVGLFQSDENTLLINVDDIQKIEGVASIRDFDNWQSQSNTEGSVMLFDEWAPKGYVYAGDKKYVFPKMNYDILEGAVVSQFKKDSIFNLGVEGYDKIVFNNKVFKSIFTPSRGGNAMYQVVFECPDYSIVKEFAIEIREANPNPMINRSKRKIIQKEYYYKLVGQRLERFKFKKKNILALAGDQADDLEAYAKANRLSFKDDDDVAQILIQLYKMQHQ
ncbi:hypothetical protein [Gilvibacter sp.]|uniref:hypothetical protein n=1 Tax=Gilvibacter sp. TaxID=2729997 RepID=UPI003B51B740